MVRHNAQDCTTHSKHGEQHLGTYAVVTSGMSMRYQKVEESAITRIAKSVVSPKEERSRLTSHVALDINAYMIHLMKRHLNTS